MSAILNWLYSAIAPFLAKRFIAEAETQTAIQCAESLRQAYARADDLDSSGFSQLAQELRKFADGIDIAGPSGRTLGYLEELLDEHPTLDRKASGNGSTQLGSSAAPPAIEQVASPQKRRTGRPRKTN